MKKRCQLRGEPGDTRSGNRHDEVISLMDSGVPGGVTHKLKTTACSGENGGLLLREEPVLLFCLSKRCNNKGHSRLPAKWSMFVSLWRSVCEN